jgi:hypothetical protein
MTSELDVIIEGLRCMLAIVNINNLRAGSTYEIKIEIALTTTVEGVCIAVFTASITIFFLWLLRKNKGVVWVEGVLLYLGRQLHAGLMEGEIALGGGGAFVSGTKYWLLVPQANNVFLAFIFHFFCEHHVMTMPRPLAEV